MCMIHIFWIHVILKDAQNCLLFSYVFQIFSKLRGEYPPQTPLAQCEKKNQRTLFVSFCQKCYPEWWKKIIYSQICKLSISIEECDHVMHIFEGNFYLKRCTKLLNFPFYFQTSPTLKKNVVHSIHVVLKEVHDFQLFFFSNFLKNWGRMSPQPPPAPFEKKEKEHDLYFSVRSGVRNGGKVRRRMWSCVAHLFG